ncbi:hypothetical protein TNCV_4209291 [Trichonephila clavipes]|nr:hypothetical protein TNCV_4209291 [Trichonephila clavipes]
MDSDDVPELLDSHNQELTIDELIEIHEKTIRTPSHDRDKSDFSVVQQQMSRSFTCFHKSAKVEVKVLMREVG